MCAYERTNNQFLKNEREREEEETQQQIRIFLK